MGILTRAKRNISFKFAGELFSRIISVIFFIYVARKLGDVGFGKYSFAYSFCGLFMIFLDLGLKTLFIRNVAGDKSNTEKYISNMIGLKIVLSILVFGLVVLIVNILNYSFETKVLISIMYIVIISTEFLEYIFAVFGSWEKMDLEAFLKILNKIFIASFGLSALFFLGNTVALAYKIDIFVGAMAFGYFLSIAAGFYLIKRNISTYRVKYDFSFWFELIKNALPLTLTVVFIILYLRVDVVLLSFFGRPEAEIGWYAAGIKIIDTLNAVPLLIVSGIFPIFADLHKTQPEKLKNIYKKSTKIMVVLSIPLVLTIFIFSDILIAFVYGQNFAKTSDVLKILVWSIFFVFLNYLFMNILIAVEKQKFVAISTGICVLVNIILNILLIPQLGYIGAGISVVLTQAVLLLLNYYFITRYAFVKNDRLITEPAKI